MITECEPEPSLTVHPMQPVSLILMTLALIGSVIYLTSCGGGPQANVAPIPPPVVTPTPPPPSLPPPPPTIPANWAVTDLPPLAGFNASQGNAVNASGVVVGYSETPAGVTEATEWLNGVTLVDLGPGIATAINDAGYIVGYSADSTGMFFTAHLWFNGSESDIGTDWLPQAINNHNLVVGTPLSFGVAQQWEAIKGQADIPGCQAATSVNDSGQIAGIGLTTGNATICGMPDFGILGAATAINSSGVTVGYDATSAVDAVATQWPKTVIADNGLATGINDLGWVVGEVIDTGGLNVLARLGKRAVPRAHILGAIRKLAGQSHPFIWSQATGLISLPALLTAENISGTRITGAGLAPDGTIHGFLLEGKQ